MRQSLLAIGFIVVFGLPLHAQEGDARAIIEKAINAQGDEKTGQKLRTNTGKSKGELHIADMKFNLAVQSWIESPGKAKVVMSMSGDGGEFEIIQVLNGAKSWVSVGGMLMDLDDEQMKEAKAMTHVERVTSLFGIKGDKELTLTPLGDSKVGDATVVGVKVSKKGERDVSLFFDKKTNLLAKCQYRSTEPVGKTEVTQEKFYSGYKEMVPGFKSATKTITKNDGELFMELEVMEIRPVDRHDEKIFAKPDEPRR